MALLIACVSRIFYVPDPGRDTQGKLHWDTKLPLHPDPSALQCIIVEGKRRTTPGYGRFEEEVVVYPGDFCMEVLQSSFGSSNVFNKPSESVYEAPLAPFAYPACMSLLSGVLVAMWFYNMMLLFGGWVWSQFDGLFTRHVVLSLCNGLQVASTFERAPPREPPDPDPLDMPMNGNQPLRKAGKRCHGALTIGSGHTKSFIKSQKAKQRRKRGLTRRKLLLLTAFGLLSLMGSSSASCFNLTSELDLRTELRKHRAYTGMLKTDDLHPRLLAQVQSTLSFSAQSFYDEAVEHASGAIHAIADTGCSHSCSPFEPDFVPGTLRKLDEPIQLGGIAGNLQVQYEGTLCWETLNDRGDLIEFKTKGYLVPGLPSRLFSPQSFLHNTQRLKDHFRVWHDRVEWWVNNQKVMTMNYDPQTFLPQLTLFKSGTADKVLHAMAGIVTQETNQNLTPLRKLWLQWHFKLGHLGFQHVQWLTKLGGLGAGAFSGELGFDWSPELQFRPLHVAPCLHCLI